MLQLKYPSKEFGPAWRKAIDGEEEFEVDARIRRFIKPSMKFHIDTTFGRHHPRNWLGSLPAGMFTGDIMVCIAVAYYSKKYDVEYSEKNKGLLVTFRRI